MLPNEVLVGASAEPLRVSSRSREVLLRVYMAHSSGASVKLPVLITCFASHERQHFKHTPVELPGLLNCTSPESSAHFFSHWNSEAPRETYCAGVWCELGRHAAVTSGSKQGRQGGEVPLWQAGKAPTMPGFKPGGGDKLGAHEVFQQPQHPSLRSTAAADAAHLNVVSFIGSPNRPTRAFLFLIIHNPQVSTHQINDAS